MTWTWRAESIRACRHGVLSSERIVQNEPGGGGTDPARMNPPRRFPARAPPTPLPTSHGHGHDRAPEPRRRKRAAPAAPYLIAEGPCTQPYMYLRRRASTARGCRRGSSLGRSARAPDQSRSWGGQGHAYDVCRAWSPFFSRHMLLNQGSRVARFQKKKRDAVFRPRCRGVGRLLWSSEGCLVSVVSMCLEVAVSHRLTLTASIAILPVSELPQCYPFRR